MSFKKSSYSDFNCKHCGRLVKAGEYSSHVYFPICPRCNDKFWDKWYKLPKVKRIKEVWLRTQEHDNLIHEYHKEDYFREK